ncbi:SDR family NAD(P)-dependent oxidoreductase [Mesorhizobium sp. M0659]|uniref:SDR family NAD(P)-dependent oxidoreductase n=1 Tax=Mesorhizobium sp. M0659 TaxID=2956980 RepID=UPI003337B26D
MSKIWLVTGAASGLGREIARAALEQGDTVLLADRRTDGAAELVTTYSDRAIAVEMDVTNQSQVDNVVADAINRFDRIDVLVNAAGRGHIGSVEDTPESDLRSLIELVLFGPVRLTKAVLPHMRSRRTGAIVQISSQAGQMSVPGMSSYSAGKFALEGLSIALAQEVSALGIKVMIVQPGAMRTNFAGPAISESPMTPDYRDSVGKLRQHVDEVAGKEPGDPVKIAHAILAALAAENTPVRLAMGNSALDTLLAADRQTHNERIKWEGLSRSTDFTA